MFSGLMSRCTMPASCATQSALAICCAISKASLGGIGPARHPLTQGRAFDELRRNVMNATDLADLVNSNDVGMIQRGSGACFALQALQLHLVRNERLRQKFERDVSPEPFVVREIDYAHSAHAEDRFDPIVSEMLTDKRVGVVEQEFGCDFERGRRDEVTRLIVILQEQFHFVSQGCIAVTTRSSRAARARVVVQPQR